MRQTGVLDVPRPAREAYTTYIRRGPGNRLNIPWDSQTEASCRNRINQSGHLNPAARRTKPGKRR